MKYKDLRTDCRFFSGYKPCLPHKTRGQVCGDCKDYSPEKFRILIIKTGAAGDVIRTTPILVKLRELYPQAHISWLTRFPELIPNHLVDRVFSFSWEASMQLLGEKFNLLLALDKEPLEGSLAGKIQAQQVKGFLMNDKGKVLPADPDAEGKWRTGVDDRAMRANSKHFVEELFDICGFEFRGETYQMNVAKEHDFGFPEGAPIVALNTGSGPRWATRRWPVTHFKSLALDLRQRGYNVVLLGGPEEDAQNRELALQTGSFYPGVVSFQKFSELVKGCDVLVTGVTLALHVALAQETRVVLMNNIFPDNEFFLYGLGEVLGAKLGCRACYKAEVDLQCESLSCMGLIESDHVVDAIHRQLGQIIPVPAKAAEG